MWEALVIIILVLLCFVGVCADVLIIYTLLRFKKLRSPFNTILANWAICDLCTIILAPITYYVVMFMAFSGVRQEFVSILVQSALNLHVTEVLFGIVLCIDWCLVAYFKRLSEKFRKYYRYVIGSVWVLTLLFCIVATVLSINNICEAVPMIFFGIFYAICFVFVIILNCSRIVQKFRTFPVTYPKPLPLNLTLITVIIFSYLLGVINMTIMYFEAFYHIIYDYFVISAIISICAVLASSVVTLILLCCLNYDFRQCLFQLKESVRHQRFDGVSETEDKNNPKISFHTSTQDIVENGHVNLNS